MKFPQVTGEEFSRAPADAGTEVPVFSGAALFSASGKKTPSFRRYAVLSPHRDILPAFRAWQERLFLAGLAGIHAFPPVIPLAVIAGAGTAKPLRGARLETLAENLRGLLSRDGFFTSNGKIIITEQDGLVLGGPGIAFPFMADFMKSFAEPGMTPFTPLFLCAFAAASGRAEQYRAIAESMFPPEIRFRAASLANLVFAFSAENGFASEWKRGRLFWLPKKTAPAAGYGDAEN